MAEIIGFTCAIFIGLVMGLTGAGGAILTVPVLVYIFQIAPVTATAYSLFIVGTTSVFGTLQNLRKQTVAIKTGFLYALPSVGGVFLSRKFIITALPDPLIQIGNFLVPKNTFLMVLFAVIMCLAGLAMVRTRPDNQTEAQTQNPALLVIKLFFAGIIVGMVGAGGGFLFVPVLVHVARLSMKKAAATSLMIISINSLIGFTGDLGNLTIDFSFLLKFAALAIVGIFSGIYLNRFVNDVQLKKGFGWFVLVMAAFIFTREVIL